MSPAVCEAPAAREREWRAWAEREFCDVDLGDTRRERRLKEITAAFVAAPQESIPRASGSWPSAKAAYRFFSNKRVEPEQIYECHRRRVIERCQGESVVLAIGDTTMLDYTAHPGTLGLGPLADTVHHGFVVQPTLVVTPQRVPLGLIDQQTWIRDIDEFGRSGEEDRRARPIDEKESRKWLVSLTAGDRLQREVGSGDTQVVAVFDREGDVFDVLSRGTSPETKCGLLVRARSDRRLEHPQKHLWEYLKSRPVAGIMDITVPRKPGQKAREAELTVRYSAVEVRPPSGRLASEKLEPVRVFAVYARENSRPPSDQKRVSWMLLTTVPVRSVEDACRIVEWYACRWMIEIFFKVLKSGCKAEERQLEEAERLKRCLAVDCIVAWRILYLTTIGRNTPEVPCTVVFEDYEWKAVWAHIHRTPEVPAAPPKLREMVKMIGRLGGHLGRKQDKMPGPMTMWRGLQRVPDFASMWLLFQNPTKSPLRSRRPRRN